MDELAYKIEYISARKDSNDFVRRKCLQNSKFIILAYFTSPKPEICEVLKYWVLYRQYPTLSVPLLQYQVGGSQMEKKWWQNEEDPMISFSALNSPWRFSHLWIWQNCDPRTDNVEVNHANTGFEYWRCVLDTECLVCIKSRGQDELIDTSMKAVASIVWPQRPILYIGQ